MFEEGILVIIIGGCVVLGTIIGVAITWQTLRGAIMANIKEFASLRALGVGMPSLPHRHGAQLLGRPASASPPPSA
jgi:putative ABC transport system permease protein